MQDNKKGALESWTPRKIGSSVWKTVLQIVALKIFSKQQPAGLRLRRLATSQPCYHAALMLPLRSSDHSNDTLDIAVCKKVRAGNREGFPKTPKFEFRSHHRQTLQLSQLPTQTCYNYKTCFIRFAPSTYIALWCQISSLSLRKLRCRVLGSRSMSTAAKEKLRGAGGQSHEEIRCCLLNAKGIRVSKNTLSTHCVEWDVNRRTRTGSWRACPCACY
jgi:hypothetical protein